MSRPRSLPWFRTAQFSVLVFALAVACPFTHAADGDKPQEDKETAKEEVPLPPEVAAKFSKFLIKVREAKDKIWARQMKKEIENVVKITGLDPEQAQALEGPAKQASDACMDGWLEKIREGMQLNFAMQPEQAVQMVDNMLARADQYALSDWYGDYTRPPEQPLWNEALHRVLSPAQAAIWDKAEADRKKAREEKIAEFLKKRSDAMDEQFHQEIRVKSAYLEGMLALPKERVSELDALAKKAAEESAKSWAKHADRILLNMDDTLFAQVSKTGNFYLPGDKKDAPEEQNIWKEGLKKFLSPEESRQIETSEQELNAKRVKVLGRMMLALLDERIGFTEDQRKQLQPLTERMTAIQPSLFPKNDMSGNSLMPLMFYSAGSKATGAEMKPILDDIQWKRWQELCAPKYKEPAPSAPEPGIMPANNSAQEMVERAISDFLYEKATQQRVRIVSLNIMKAEDAARVAGLSAEASSCLHTAALGAAEEGMATWKSYIDQNIRVQLQGATPDNVQQRLDSIQSYYFQQNFGMNSNSPNPLWDKAVKAALTPEQQAAWKKEIGARKEFLDDTASLMIAAEFARRQSLTIGQWSKIEPLISGIVKEYSKDIASSYSSSNSTPWFLQYYMMFMPCAGIPEKDLKAILTKDQWEKWTTSSEYGNSMSYWDNVKQMHAQRQQGGDQ